MKTLTCHCGAVEIQVNLEEEIDKLMRCNCSMCKRKGTMVTTINKENLKIVKGEDKIKIYNDMRENHNWVTDKKELSNINYNSFNTYLDIERNDLSKYLIYLKNHKM